MGSNAEEIPHKDDEVTVLVTGFGPFRAQYPVNPSWEIAKALPPFLPPSHLRTLSDAAAVAEWPPVRILVHPEAVRVAYKPVRELVPRLWDGRKIDLAVHIGMASGRRHYSVERRAHRDGYCMRDVDNELLGDLERRIEEGPDWIWDGLPQQLLPDTDIDEVWTRWRVALPNTDIRISEDAGRYLCDFIYYSSMAHLVKKGEEKRVVFLHVPVDSDDAAVKTGAEVTIELIRALVQCQRMRKLKEHAIRT